MGLFNAFIKISSTFFGAGYLPLIPGTFGSIAGLGLYFLLKNNTPTLVICTLILAVLGFFVASEAEKIFKSKDPRYVVIDEVVGMLLSLLFLPYNIKLVIIGFFIFRLLDTLKPYPAGAWEKKPGGLGIMSDDIIAGAYTNLILQISWRLVSLTVS